MLPLLDCVDKSRQIQNSRLSKLIEVVNTQVLINFMSDLFLAVTDNIFARYTQETSQRMNFEAFITFARDHDIFP